MKAAILDARHCVYLIGREVDTRIKFEPEHQTLDGPNKLGPLLRWFDKQFSDLCRMLDEPTPSNLALRFRSKP